jgi:hypothetical protein
MPVQVVLFVDGNEESVGRVVERILAMTAGPYELTGASSIPHCGRTLSYPPAINAAP